MGVEYQTDVNIIQGRGLPPPGGGWRAAGRALCCITLRSEPRTAPLLTAFTFC